MVHAQEIRDKTSIGAIGMERGEEDLLKNSFVIIIFIIISRTKFHIGQR